MWMIPWSIYSDVHCIPWGEAGTPRRLRLRWRCAIAGGPMTSRTLSEGWTSVAANVDLCIALTDTTPQEPTKPLGLELKCVDL